MKLAFSDYRSREIPRNAINAFEKITGLKVTVHDVCGAFWNVLDKEELQHSSMVCACVVKPDYESRCKAFDLEYVRRNVRSFSDGRLQTCHAGFSEAVTAHMNADQIEFILFAGQWRSENRKLYNQDPGRSTDTPAIREAGNRLPKLDDEQASAILELLNHLKYRLVAWLEEMRRLHQAGLKNAAAHKALPMRDKILLFFNMQPPAEISLSKLAEFLYLSESRTGHLVREVFGISFRTMRSSMKIDRASDLLRYTDLAVEEVARRSGFGNAAHFYRTFKREQGTTPRDFRRQKR